MTGQHIRLSAASCKAVSKEHTEDCLKNYCQPRFPLKNIVKDFVRLPRFSLYFITVRERGGKGQDADING